MMLWKSRTTSGNGAGPATVPTTPTLAVPDGECAAADVRMGTRVEAVWKPDGERQGDHTDIRYFRPTGEPDAPFESFIHRL